MPGKKFLVSAFASAALLTGCGAPKDPVADVSVERDTNEKELCASSFNPMEDLTSGEMNAANLMAAAYLLQGDITRVPVITACKKPSK